MSVLELLEPVVPLLPRLLLPVPDGSDDFCDPDGDEPVPLDPPVCDQACGAIINTAPLSTRLDRTFECVFFISFFLSSFLSSQ